jgi:hypothetical protein
MRIVALSHRTSVDVWGAVLLLCVLCGQVYGVSCAQTNKIVTHKLHLIVILVRGGGEDSSFG